MTQSPSLRRLSDPRTDSATPQQQTLGINLLAKHLHFVGIGGCGMSGLARLARKRGAVCSGSDRAASDITQALTDEGFNVALQQTTATVPNACDMLVVSAAIKDDHPEVTEAKRRGVEVVKYAKLLGQLMLGRTGVAIAGTHGKSTTTSLLSHILIQCKLDPSFIVGANCEQIGGGVRCGQSDTLIVEACEFDRSFHNFHPTHAVILNVEEDHLDFYSGIDEIVETFRVFAQKVDETPKTSGGGGGSLLINHEMPHRMKITAGLDSKVETIGFAPQADWCVEVVSNRVYLHQSGKCVASWASPMPGDHMAYNSAAAAVTAHRLGAEWEAIGEAIAGFEGLDRRMQIIGETRINHGRVTVIDDYGHHPTEIDTTLRALRRRYDPKRLVCVFQPHQHSRTRFLLEQFATSFSEADIVIVPQIFFVRDSENERHAVRAADLVDRLRQRGKRAMHLYPFGAIVEHLQVITQPGDLLVTMGAGDVWKVAREFLK